MGLCTPNEITLTGWKHLGQILGNGCCPVSLAELQFQNLHSWLHRVLGRGVIGVFLLDCFSSSVL